MITDVAVVVPAHDEEADIAACLAGLVESRKEALLTLPREVRIRLCVVLDSCRDSTPDVVRRFGACEQIAVSCRNVGAARAAGVRHVMTGLAAPLGQIWVASTDADSVVPVDWISGMLATRGRRE